MRAVLLNPTGYCSNFRLEDFANQGNDVKFTNDTIISPWKNSVNDDTEFERGSYKVRSLLVNCFFFIILGKSETLGTRYSRRVRRNSAFKERHRV